MKRYKQWGLLICVLMVVGLLLPRWTVLSGQDNGRIHQHRVARQPDAGCSCDGRALCTHLPLVLVDTGGKSIPGKNTEQFDFYGERIHTLADDGRSVINARLSIVDHPDGNNHPGDPPTVTTLSECRLRGHSSRAFEKASYQLSFIEENGDQRPLEVMGMSPHHQWVLNGPYLDKSLIRNYIWYNISGEIMDYAPNVRFCELLVNGEYRGVYLMVETITNGQDCRLHLRETIKDTVATSYLVRMDRPTESGDTRTGNIDTYLERTMIATNMDMSIEYPGRGSLTKKMAAEVSRELSAFERALYSYDYDSEKYGYQNWIDTSSFIDYYLINEFCKNEDAGRYSTYLYKNLQEKYRLCVWDFNNACNNFPTDVTPPEGLEKTQNLWFSMLLRDEEFVRRTMDRYQELRQSYFSDEYLNQYIDETVKYLGPAIQRNTDRWSAYIEGDQLLPAERNVHSQGEAVEQLKDWLRQRGEWMDENIHILQRYCHPSWNRAYNY